MEDLEKISIAGNGQWTLEKARKGPSQEEQDRMVAEFKQRMEQRKAAQQAAAAQRAAGGPRLVSAAPPNLRPAAINDVITPKPQPRPYKSQDESTRPPPPEVKDQSPANTNAELLDALKQRYANVVPEKTPFDRLNRQAEADDEKGAVKQQHGEAWRQTAQYLATHGDKKERTRWAKLADTMDERDRLNAAHSGEDLVDKEGRKSNMTRFDPPQERVLVPPAPMDAATAGALQRELAGVAETDPEARSKAQARIRMKYNPPDRYEMKTKKGKYHGEGATTNGRVVPRMFSYVPDPKKIDPNTGEPEKRFGKRMMQEIHHWSWDEPGQKWNRTHTAYENGDWDKKTAGPTAEQDQTPSDDRVYVLDGEGGGKLMDPKDAPVAPSKDPAVAAAPAEAPTPAGPTAAASPAVAPVKRAPQVTVKPQLKNGPVTVRPTIK